MLAIIVNTVSMAVEHHDQPLLLTTILEYTNYFFTALFAVEMALKLTAYGPAGYVKDTFNIFDGTIVIVSLIELVQGGEGGLSVLRTFRLFRVFKLVRFIPSLRYQLIIMIKCVNNVTFFFVLLCLFIFIFTLLGMVVFGGKFCHKQTELGLQIPCDCAELLRPDTECECLRWNFDTFLHAALTVFVVLSGCWCVILYDGMARVGPWAAMYFISLLAFGNYILFNLLVGILLEGFQDTNEDEVNAEVDELDYDDNDVIDDVNDTARTLVCTCNFTNNDVTIAAVTVANDTHNVILDTDEYPEWTRNNPDHAPVGNSPVHKQNCPFYNHLPLITSGSTARIEETPKKNKALITLFVLSTLDNWNELMYQGMDVVGVDQQPIRNYTEYHLLYFIAFVLVVGFFVLNMFVGVVVENFQKNCKEVEEQQREQKEQEALNTLKMVLAEKALRVEFWESYGPTRLKLYKIVSHKYFDLIIAAIIFLNVFTMAIEHYQMSSALVLTLHIMNYIFTLVFTIEAILKICALGVKNYFADGWNRFDMFIVIASFVGIALEEMKTGILPVNPTMIRVMRVLRIARVLKLLKMAEGIRSLLDCVGKALPSVGNLAVLFLLLFYIFAALGVELLGRIECSAEFPCLGMNEHANFQNFGIAFLTLFRVATGDNWSGIMADTMKGNCDDSNGCKKNCCVTMGVGPIYFIIFVLFSAFVLMNLVVAVLLKYLEESKVELLEEEAAAELGIILKLCDFAALLLMIEDS